MLPFERISNKPPRPGWLPALVLGAAFAGLVAPAWAGKYQVYSCRTPTGGVAPADGWTGTQTGAGAVALNSCLQGGSLLAALERHPGRAVDEANATWEFAPPAGDRLIAATLWRAGDALGGSTSGATDLLLLGGAESPFEECDPFSGCSRVGEQNAPLSSENEVVVHAAHLGGNLYATATCQGIEGPCAETGADANGYAAAIYLYAADLVLEQQAGPSVSGVGGELASASTVDDSAPISFAASDPLSGIFQVVFSIDGQVVDTTIPSENGGRCRPYGETGEGVWAFLFVQPCPRSLSVQVALDTTKISNGTHHLAVSVLDAAGNPAPVLERQITVHNTGIGPPNGTNATAQAALSVRWSTSPKKTRLLVPFGRPAKVEGLLTTAAGVPIAGATIDVSAQPAATGGKAAAMPGARTNSSGRFTVVVPGGVSSRTLRFGYRSHLAEEGPAVTSALTLAVKAGIVLHISPDVTSVRRDIHFSGHLRGGPVPSEGKQLVLEARSPGGPWIEFKDVRTGRRGRFHAKYRFKFPGPARYQFRVVSEPESDYPYAEGSSNLVKVFER